MQTEETMTTTPTLVSPADEKIIGWFDGKKIDELAFCEEFVKQYNFKYFEGCFYNLDGVQEDAYVESLITTKLKDAGVRYGLANKIKNLMNALRHICFTEDMETDLNEIHILNGTYRIDGTFSPEKKHCRNRINVSYTEETVKKAVVWERFVNELLEPDDVKTLQEFIGYCLLNTTKAQAMLFLVGRGGEGKSRIGVILEKLFGKACYFDSIVALSKNKFRQGNLVGKCVLVDDDMSFEGIKDTSFLKSLVTAETCISVEKKNVQAIQAKLCARAVVFSNSNPNSLYDKTDGWHRRLIVLDTKPVPPDRKPDRYLSEKLIAELDGIFFWALEGLRRLIGNDFIFTVSNKTREIMENLKQENCNVAEFMNDAQAVQLSPDSTTCSVDIYNAYVNWCQSNGLQELKQKSFYDWLYHNCESYNLSPTNKAHNGRNYVRGYVGISVSYRSKSA